MAASIRLVSGTLDDIKEVEVIGFGEPFNLKIGDCILDDRGQKHEVVNFGTNLTSITSINAKELFGRGRIVSFSASFPSELTKCSTAGGRRNKKSRRRHRKSRKNMRKGTRKHR
jgi:hypothetical protein